MATFLVVTKVEFLGYLDSYNNPEISERIESTLEDNETLFLRTAELSKFDEEFTFSLASKLGIDTETILIDWGKTPLPEFKKLADGMCQPAYIVTTEPMETVEVSYNPYDVTGQDLDSYLAGYDLHPLSYDEPDFSYGQCEISGTWGNLQTTTYRVTD